MVTTGSTDWAHTAWPAATRGVEQITRNLLDRLTTGA